MNRSNPADISRRRSILAIALSGVAFRFLLILATPSWSVTTDGARFLRLAASRMADTAFLPPLYPCFLILVEFLLGPGIPPIRIAQSILGGVSIYLTAILAGRFALPENSGRAATFAALLAAFTPPLVLADLTVMSESLTAVLLAAYLAISGFGGDEIRQ
ncbi:MAG: hypothetical protein V3U66_06075, partial [Acidobacteriota bacterium]